MLGGRTEAGCDLTAMAGLTPAAVICEILGVPFDDRDSFTAWGNTLAEGLDRPRSLGHARSMDAASVQLTAYLSHLLEQRRRAPEEQPLLRQLDYPRPTKPFKGKP